MPHVLLAGRMHEAGVDLLRSVPGVTFDRVDEISTESYAPLVPAADAIVIRTQPLPAAVIARAPRLAIVSRHGVGYDAVDIDALTARRIPLAICGDVNSTSVAEHTMMLMLAAAKRALAQHAGVRAGDWQVRNRYDGFELAGKTLLLVGFGRIGRAVARLATAFGMTILAFDPYQPDAVIQGAGAEPVRDLDAAWPRADIVSIHMPRQDGAPVIGTRALALMKATAILVNTARGGIVDEHALDAALRAGRLGAAGLDVLASEPPDPADPILANDRVVLSPHNASLTGEAAARMAIGAVTNVLDFFAGRLDPTLVVNRAALAKHPAFASA